MNGTMEKLRNELLTLCQQIDHPVQLMEVCGTHTVSIFRAGIRSMLPPNLRLVSGPGCPVCVTAQRHIDAAIHLGARQGVIMATYGDMMRVPGRDGSLERLRAAGAQIRVINSARSVLQIARESPDKQVVFLAIGFETTAPATAAIVVEAKRAGVENLSVLMCHKRVVPAMLALLEGGNVPIDGFLCPGHVSVVIGADAYRPVVAQHNKPCVVAGFEPEQVLNGLVHLARQVLKNQPRLENVYGAVVCERGNPVALELLERVFVLADTPWRALGVIPNSGFELAPAYQHFDALRRFNVRVGQDEDHRDCRCGEVIQGRVQPDACPLFAHACTPLTPVGPCMVSSEGTCAAWYRYQRRAGSDVSNPAGQEVAG